MKKYLILSVLFLGCYSAEERQQRSQLVSNYRATRLLEKQRLKRERYEQKLEINRARAPNQNISIVVSPTITVQSAPDAGN